MRCFYYNIVYIEWGRADFAPFPTLELVFENLCIQFNSPTIKRGIFSVEERIEGVIPRRKSWIHGSTSIKFYHCGKCSYHNVKKLERTYFNTYNIKSQQNYR